MTVRVRRPERERESFRVDAYDSFTGLYVEIGWVTRERGGWWLIVESEDNADDGIVLRVRIPPSMVKALIRERAELKGELARREREELAREAEARRRDSEQAERKARTG